MVGSNTLVFENQTLCDESWLNHHELRQQLISVRIHVYADQHIQVSTTYSAAQKFIENQMVWSVEWMVPYMILNDWDPGSTHMPDLPWSDNIFDLNLIYPQTLLLFIFHANPNHLQWIQCWEILPIFKDQIKTTTWYYAYTFPPLRNTSP